MAGIYLHIPFCRQACTYCNFHFSISLHHKDALLQALSIETRAEAAYLGGETVETIYFGGGTPSLLTTAELDQLLQTIRSHYPVSPNAEITLEANPDDISHAVLSDWKSIGINRLSLGVQSFVEEELRWMNRAHNASQALQAVEAAVKQFDNITLDLIYGSPLLSDEQWKTNVDLATSLGIRHLSCYALTVEEKTPLHKLIRNESSPEVDSDRQADQFLLLMQWLREKGYEHYEVSNFALPGYRSKHNSAYWKGKPYLGLGPSAHSFNGSERRWNVANNQRYISSVVEGSAERETEVLTNTQQLNEFLMIALRTKEGIALQILEERWGKKERERVSEIGKRFEKEGLLYVSEDAIRLSDNGMLRADGLAAEMFL